LKTTGIGESNLQERINRGLGYDDVVLSFRTMLPENHVKLRFSADATDDYVQQITDDIAARIGTPVFAIHHGHATGGGLADTTGQALGIRGETVATAESCTGGRIGAMFTAVPGSSAWFTQGAITYSNDAKIRMLGVDPATLEAHGAVSEAVAREMAAGIRERAGTTYGLSATGIAGPGGGSDEKPVGTIHIAVATPNEIMHRPLHLGGDRDRIQTLSAAAVIDTLRRHLQEQ
jgi:nicotinamide-nucleotide amidase